MAKRKYPRKMKEQYQTKKSMNDFWYTLTKLIAEIKDKDKSNANNRELNK